ncbi:hypothetical protein DIPPA_15463 [Diplonema papillatum]|nr:hypothetical protein DIPPA_15463 [Diplonema papillatum]
MRPIAVVLSLAVCLGSGNETAAPCALGRNLRHGMGDIADEYGWVCCGNSKFAEPSGTMSKHGDLAGVMEADARNGRKTTFYDVSCGLPVFVAPVNRTVAEWLKESRSHGWPSFRPAEVVHQNVVHQRHGEVLSACGTHLGHNIPDRKGDRYCINLLCVAGNPPREAPAVRPADRAAAGLPAAPWFYLASAAFALSAAALWRCYSGRRRRGHSHTV